MSADSELEGHRTAQQDQGSGTCPSKETTIFLGHQQTPQISAQADRPTLCPIILRTIKENILSIPTELDRSAQGAVLTIENETEIDGSKCGVTRATCEAGVVALE